jgi:hypothetical protein
MNTEPFPVHIDPGAFRNVWEVAKRAIFHFDHYVIARDINDLSTLDRHLRSRHAVFYARGCLNLGVSCPHEDHSGGRC